MLAVRRLGLLDGCWVQALGFGRIGGHLFGTQAVAHM